MATFLHRVGRWAFRRRRTVVLVWVAVLAAVFLGASSASEASEDSSSLPGIESQQAFDLINERFPGAEADGAEARIVFVAERGQQVTSAASRSAIGELVEAVADGPQVADAASPFDANAVSKDKSTAYATVTYKVASDDLTDASKTDLTKAVEQARDAGLTVEVGGSALETEAAQGLGEVLGVLVAAVVLLITFGSLAAAGLPLLTAILGVSISLAAITALSSAFGFSSTVGELAMMLGLAVGIDYSLFVVSRYREERAKGHQPQEAAALAVGTAGSAVVFAGLTVVIALLGLSVIGVPMLSKMGIGSAGAVMVGVLIALTAVPALLGFWPNAVLSRRDRKGGRRSRTKILSLVGRTRTAGTTTKAPRGVRWAQFVVRRPLPVLLLSVIGLGALAVPSLDLRMGMPGDEAKSTATTERRAYDALAEGFGPGFNGPLTVVVDVKKAKDPQAAVTAVSEKLADTKGVVSVSPARFNEAKDTAVIAAVPSTAPTSRQTQDLVHTIRSERSAVESATGADFKVTGTTALNIDVGQKMQDALIPYLAVVVGLAFLLLALVFRSILVPLKAALGFLLSVGAALGAIVTVFQQGHGAGLFGVDETGPIMSTMPIFLVGIVFGLAMDYQVFLVSRIREAHIHGERPDQAIVTGFRHSAQVVGAAALIMMAVFGGFMTGGESLVKMVGFGLASAVFFDAFVVRMAFVPAVLALLGKRAWWLPRWLDRLMPRVDVEGEALTQQVSAPNDLPADDPRASVTV
ncbi:RND superfamily putative drug exporter [Streptomyces umbrinus]|uniref:RND superfamily putative drug exporter n=1 Tax=Streptomyces umbrinus TaxID=67370 RepID=A0ABU0TCI6_9ACTN|nr:MMPL family transporter [Streptomyces umbrinus]MDQ1033398.1 RND superfamily putative drug exporter [Streptomyces umbrinus]